MAILRGKGAYTNRELIVVHYPNSVSRDGKTQFVDVQVLASDAHKDDYNFHLAQEKEEITDPALAERLGKKVGDVRYNNNIRIDTPDFEKIVEAAGDSKVHVPSLMEGKPGANVYSIIASVKPEYDRHGNLTYNAHIDMSKPIMQGPAIDENVLSNQIEAMKTTYAQVHGEKQATLNVDTPEVAEATVEASPEMD